MAKHAGTHYSMWGHYPGQYTGQYHHTGQRRTMAGSVHQQPPPAPQSNNSNQNWDIRKRMNALLQRDAQLNQQIQCMQLKMGGKKLGKDKNKSGGPHNCVHPQMLGWNARSRVPVSSDSSNMSSYFDDITRFDPAATSAELSLGEYSSSICVSINCESRCRKVKGLGKRESGRKPLRPRNSSMDFTSVSAIPEHSQTSLRHKSSHGTFVNGPLYSTMNYPQNSTPEHTLSGGLSAVLCDEQIEKSDNCSECHRWEAASDEKDPEHGNRLDPTGRDSKLNVDFCPSSDDEGIEGDDEFVDEIDDEYCTDLNLGPGHHIYGNCPEPAHSYNPTFCNRGTCRSCSAGSSCSSNSSLMVPHNSYMTGDSNESSSHIYEQIFIDDIPTRACPLPSSQRPPCIGKEATPPVCRIQTRCPEPKVSFKQADSKLIQSLGSDGSSQGSTDFSQKSLIDESKALNYSVASSVHVKGIFCCGPVSRSKKSHGRKKSVSKKFKGLSKQLQKFGQDKTNVKTLALV